MEFITKYWFLIFIVLFFVGTLWKFALKSSEGENKWLSVLLTLFIFVPPWFLSSEKSLISMFYAVFVGIIILFAYYKTSLCMFFRGLEGVSKSLFYPPSKKWLLVLGYLLVFVPPIQYISGAL